MFAILTVVLFVLLSTLLLHASSLHEISRENPWSQIAKLKERNFNNGGCGGQICFAIQSSRSIGMRNFELQKTFVRLAAGKSW